MPGRIIGIDFGSLSAHVAACDQHGNPTLVPMPGGHAYPTWYAVDSKGQELIGNDAQRQWARNPERTIYGLRRLLGQRNDSATLRHWQARASYPMGSDDEGNVTLPLRDPAITPVLVLTRILARLRDIAAQHLQQPVGGAVITVPAAYGHRQRLAVRLAAQQAGFELVRCIPELAALALAYSAHATQGETAFFYRMGAGSFDAAVAQVGPATASLTCAAGDLTSGGLDIDHVLMMYLASEFETKHGSSVLVDAVACQRLREAAERIKRDLSRSTSASVELPLITLTSQGRPLDLAATVTRDELNLLVEPLVDRTMDRVRHVLHEKRCSPKTVGSIIVAGGQTTMPLLQQRLHDLFRKPGVSWHPEGAAALGAAIDGHQRRRGRAACDDVLTQPIGIQGATGSLHEVFARNTALPTQRVATFTTHRDQQRELVVRLFEGTTLLGDTRELIGEYTFGELRAGPAGSIRVEVAFEVSDDGVLTLAGRDPDTGAAVPCSTRFGVSAQVP